MFTFRELQPAGPRVAELEPPPPPKGGGKQRNVQACNECRKSRIKCDGARPSCTTCTTRKRSCKYLGSEGQTRIEAEKDRLELLEKVIKTLRSGSSDQAAEILSGIRSNGDISSLLEGLTVDAPAQPTTPPQSVHSASNSRGTSGERSLPSGNSVAASNPSESSSRAPITSKVELLVPNALPSGQSSLGKRSTTSDSGAVSVLVPSGAYRITLPNANEAGRAVRGFFKCSGQLFHVFSEPVVMQMYDVVYGRSADPENASNSHICCLMSVAAIGAQYEHSSHDLVTETAFYDIAKHYFDHIVQEGGLDAVKVCVMLSLYNIMHKHTVALAYVEVGLSLVRQFQLATEESKYPGLPASVFIESKHTWRTLTFLSSWLSSTLGYISGNDPRPNEKLPLGVASHDSDILEIVQAEMTNVAVLKSKILRMHLAFKDLTVLSVHAILTDLQTWYGRMPPQIRLDYQGRNAFTPLTKWSIYHVHLLYLGANILLYRRMSSQLMESYQKGSSRGVAASSLERLYADHGQQAVLAAKGSARIVTLLLQDCGVFRRCWLVIFQAYTSCLVILHSAMQKVLHGWSSTSWQDDLHKASLCLLVLKHCASADPTAKRFHEAMQEVHDHISAQSNAPRDESRASSMPKTESVADSLRAFEEHPKLDNRIDAVNAWPDLSYLTTVPSNAKREHVERSFQLLNKLCEPFGDPNQERPGIEDVKERWRDEPTRGLDTLMMARLDWDLESRQPFYWDAKLLAPGSGELTTQESHTQEHANKKARLEIPRDLGGRFLGSISPSGWASFAGADPVRAAPKTQGPVVTVDEVAISD